MRIDTIIGSLIGSFAIYGFVAACSSGAGGQLLAEAGLIDSPADNSPVPEAEAAPADCTQWEVHIINASLLTPYNTGNWEPIGADLLNSETGASHIAVRRCVP